MDNKIYQKQWAEDRRKKGQCRRCNQPVVINKMLCKEHLEISRSDARAAYNKNKNNKNCAICKIVPIINTRCCALCQKKVRDKFAIERKKTKKTIIDHYGGSCVCCKENTITFLVIDHIDGGGEKQRKELNRPCGYRFYKWLIENNYPKGLQVMCHNCHFAKTTEGSCSYHASKNILEIDL